MTDSDAPPAIGSASGLSFASPLSAERAARLTAELAGARPETVLDLGCGWGELMLRIVAATPGARGTGIDNYGPDIERGRANAAERGRWLLAHPGHPQADEVRAQLDGARSIWLRGHRDIFGFAYLTLGVALTCTLSRYV